MKRNYFIFYAFTAFLLIGGCATKPQSDVDTPEYHFRAGMRAVDSGNYDAALNSFQRALDLDKKFIAAYAGLGLANAYQGNTKAAKKYWQGSWKRWQRSGYTSHMRPYLDRHAEG